jgi:hypothetical protein
VEYRPGGARPPPGRGAGSRTAVCDGLWPGVHRAVRRRTSVSGSRRGGPVKRRSGWRREREVELSERGGAHWRRRPWRAQTVPSEQHGDGVGGRGHLEPAHGAAALGASGDVLGEPEWTESSAAGRSPGRSTERSGVNTCRSIQAHGLRVGGRDVVGPNRSSASWCPARSAGHTYEPHTLGINNYEAVLRVQADGGLFYYAPGWGIFTPRPDERRSVTADRDLREQVLHRFRHLVWLGPYPLPPALPTLAVVAKVVATYPVEP